jgi:hypothetical protein
MHLEFLLCKAARYKDTPEDTISCGYWLMLRRGLYYVGGLISNIRLLVLHSVEKAKTTTKIRVSYRRWLDILRDRDIQRLISICMFFHLNNLHS